MSASEDSSYLRIAVQDSTGDPVAVDELFNVLNESGYRNVYLDDDWHHELPITRIVAQQGDQASAATLQRFLGVGDVRVESTGVLNSDITIQLGRDWLQEYGTSSSLY